MVAAGAEHTAAVTEDGSLYGRGWGNLGLGDRNDLLVPEKVSMVNGKNGGKKKREFGDFGGRASWIVKAGSFFTGNRNTNCPFSWKAIRLGMMSMGSIVPDRFQVEILFWKVTARLRIYLITVLYGSINVLKGEGEAKTFHG
ncbi:hypothetical protein ACFX15_016721 [Malus domestica]